MSIEQEKKPILMIPIMDDYEQRWLNKINNFRIYRPNNEWKDDNGKDIITLDSDPIFNSTLCSA